MRHAATTLTPTASEHRTAHLSQAAGREVAAHPGPAVRGEDPVPAPPARLPRARGRRSGPPRQGARRLVLGAVGAAVLLASGSQAAPLVPRGVTPEDTYALDLPMELALSPDGRTAVYALASADREEDVYTYGLWRLDLAAAERGERPAPVALPGTGFDPGGAVFAPDGRTLAYVSAGEEGAELRLAPVGPHGHVGRGQIVYQSAEGLGELAWSPDGQRLVFTRFDAAAEDVTETSPWVVTRSLVRRDGEGFLDERRSHLWVIDRRGGEPRQLTFGPWDDSEPQWSPDGRWIVFVSSRHHADPDLTDDSDLYLVAPDGTGLRRLPSGPGPDTTPRWSHRGDRIAYLSSRRANDFYQPVRLATIQPQATRPAVVDLTGHLDAGVAADVINWAETPAAPQWSPDDTTLVVPLERRGANHVVAVPSDRAGAPVRELVGGAAVHDLVRLRPDGSLLFARTDPTQPPELFLAAAAPSAAGSALAARQLTHLHKDWLARRTLVTPTKVTARSGDGEEVEGWLYPPRDRAAGRRYPLIVYIHGGPMAFDGDWFDYGLENQLFPAAGWAVLRVNYRGSTSYGEAFARSIWADWHRREHADLMAVLDQAIASNPWIDPARLGIGGWSYGGIQTVWTVGHTDRFRVGVPERFVIDYLAAFGEDQWFTWYLSELGSPYEDEARYRRLSPGTYSGNIRTPLYLIANENDHNCPLPQALRLYQRLKLRGVPTELVVYPGAAHTMDLPSHLVDRLERLLRWFGRHLDG
jgi:dipeptidyl aminopeptidase/acylaminoacyl peptidase